MRVFKSKKWLVAGAVGALVISGGVAFAIVQGTASGSGSGSTTAGSAVSCPVTLSVDFDTSGITPGGTATIDFDATNKGTVPCLIKTISATVVSGVGPVSSTNITPLGGCQGVINEQQSQFWLTPVGSSSLTNAPVPQGTGSGVVVPAGATNDPLPNSGILHWATTAFDQSLCLGEPLTLAVQTP